MSDDRFERMTLEEMRERFEIRGGKGKNKTVIDKVTGEILSKDQKEELLEVANRKAKWQTLFPKNLANAAGKELRTRFFFVDDKQKSPQTENLIKIPGDFNKIVQDSVRDLLLENLPSQPALAFIALFTPFLSFPDNLILIDGVPPTADKLAKVFKSKRNKIQEILTELESREIIKRVRGRPNLIYFNPFLYCCGQISQNTYELFKDSRYNTETTE